jgi:hypothetical protein
VTFAEAGMLNAAQMVSRRLQRRTKKKSQARFLDSPSGMAIKACLGGKAMRVPRTGASAVLFWPIDQVRSLLRQRAEKKLTAAGFDREWYLGRHPDVRAAKFDPLAHFLKWGAREGRDPNPLFWTDYYRAQNPDVRDAGLNPLAHYLRSGWREGCDPNPLFDSDWYLRENADVAAAGANPLLHFIRHGAAEGRDPHPLFDTDWYLEKNPDLRTTGINPLAHFLTVGATTGCDPHPLFDSMYYLERYPNVRDAAINPLSTTSRRAPRKNAIQIAGS